MLSLWAATVHTASLSAWNRGVALPSAKGGTGNPFLWLNPTQSPASIYILLTGCYTSVGLILRRT